MVWELEHHTVHSVADWCAAKEDTLLPDNQGRACEAAVRVIEKRLGAKRGLIQRPETDSMCPVDMRIDYLVDIGSATWAIEHTLIEAFPNQIQDGYQFSRLVAPLESAFSKGLPTPGAYHLIVPPGALKGVKRHELPELQNAISEWIGRSIPKLGAPPNHIIADRPSGMRSDIQLARLKAPWREGRLSVVREKPVDLENKRVERIQGALSDKLPKLRRWESSSTRSMLVLEDCDIALSNDYLIGKAFLEAIKGADGLPDYICLVETCTPAWAVYVLAADRELAPQSRHEFYEFERGDLPDLQ